MNWKKLTIAVVGGDFREREIARCAAETGATVRAYGFPWPEQGIENVSRAASAGEALSGADVALFPIPGIAPDGALFTSHGDERIIPDREKLAAMRQPAHIILGWGDPKLKAAAESLSVTLHEYEWDVDLMLLRGPSIVEGMLNILIENTDISLHKARIVMVGQGTIGSLATQTLVKLGAYVSVFARNPVQRASAYAVGAEAYDLSELPNRLSETDILLSSVPAPVVDRVAIEQLPKRALLVDLAAPPGGIDRDAVSELGLKFVWARGLGRRAPVTVGRSQWSGIRPRIEKIFGDSI